MRKFVAGNRDTKEHVPALEPDADDSSCHFLLSIKHLKELDLDSELYTCNYLPPLLQAGIMQHLYSLNIFLVPDTQDKFYDCSKYTSILLKFPFVTLSLLERYQGLYLFVDHLHSRLCYAIRHYVPST